MRDRPASEWLPSSIKSFETSLHQLMGHCGQGVLLGQLLRQKLEQARHLGTGVFTECMKEVTQSLFTVGSEHFRLAQRRCNERHDLTTAVRQILPYLVSHCVLLLNQASVASHEIPNRSSHHHILRQQRAYNLTHIGVI